MKKNKAQIWGLDVIVGFGLFLVGILVFFTYTINYSEESSEDFDLLFYDGESLANSLMSQGYPADWNSSTVVTLGITTDNRINQSKLENFYNMVYGEGNYDLTKRKFNTRYDYYFFFEDNMTINFSSVEGIGFPGVSKNNITSQNLIKITRYTIYQNKTVPLYIYIWE